ncbi:MAG: hypothetical protein EKK48_31415 [Candidatus Melainabacteria bacterium]|nr:MAG: hypothetical protein EKK48_31415 [Candidatus Melainabacteria bacterium]
MPMNTLTHQKMELFLRCRKKFRETVAKNRGQVSPEQQVAQIVGKAVELATATSDLEKRQVIIEAAMQQIADEDQTVEALQRVKNCVSRSDELRSDERASAVRTQRQFKWFDEVTRWTLMAKPDFTRFARDDRGPVLQIIDEKTAGHVTSYQKRFLHFLGFVIGKQLDEEKRQLFAEAKRLDIQPTYALKENSFLAELVNEFGIDVIYQNVSIELVIRLLGDSDNPEDKPREVSIGFKKRSRDWQQLAEIREVITGIEAAFDAAEFPGKPGWYCEKCPFRSTCAAYQAQLAQHAVDELSATA